MGFYDRKLAQQTQAPQQPRLPAPAITPQAHTQADYFPPDVSPKLRLAQQAQDAAGFCPGCGSGNYVAPNNRYNGDGSSFTIISTDGGTAAAMAHCFDCGFNPRLGTQMAALGGTASSASVGTKQTADGGMVTHNYHEQSSGVHMIGL